MKTAVSVPDELFERAEVQAQAEKKSRSRLYSDALAEYLRRRAPDAVTEAMNRVCDEVGDQDDGFVRAAARRTLKNVEW